MYSCGSRMRRESEDETRLDKDEGAETKMFRGDLVVKGLENAPFGFDISRLPC